LSWTKKVRIGGGIAEGVCDATAAVSLAQMAMVSGNTVAAAAIGTALHELGWCFLALPPSLAGLLPSAAEELEVFFARDETAKRGCAAFNETGRKEGLRCLTGSRVPQLPCPLLARVINELDDWMALIVEGVFGAAFDQSEFPLSDPAGFGMFDAVRYFNNAGDERELNCEPHVGTD
jgi:hypothetical protein